MIQWFNIWWYFRCHLTYMSFIKKKKRIFRLLLLSIWYPITLSVTTQRLRHHGNRDVKLRPDLGTTFSFLLKSLAYPRRNRSREYFGRLLAVVNHLLHVFYNSSLPQVWSHGLLILLGDQRLFHFQWLPVKMTFLLTHPGLAEIPASDGGTGSDIIN